MMLYTECCRKCMCTEMIRLIDAKYINGNALYGGICERNLM